jgi:2-hydroxychromene-2-carboxylate isomerase
LSHIIDYYFAPQSPWTYLGHERFAHMAHASGATIRVKPMDLGGKIFPISGGLPLAQRPPQRQAYRLLELRRFSHFLGIPLNPKPKHFPVPADEGARLIISVDLHDGAAAAMKFAGAMQAAVWAQERDVSDHQVLAHLLEECGLLTQRLVQAREPKVQERYELNTQQAIELGIFGAPSYVVDGEIFWGQDRLDFLERKLQS